MQKQANNIAKTAILKIHVFVLYLRTWSWNYLISNMLTTPKEPTTSSSAKPLYGSHRVSTSIQLNLTESLIISRHTGTIACTGGGCWQRPLLVCLRHLHRQRCPRLQSHRQSLPRPPMARPRWCDFPEFGALGYH
jgi:hypothetical protein